MNKLKFPSNCPNCNSSNIDAGIPNKDTPYEPNHYFCYDCSHKWQDDLD